MEIERISYRKILIVHTVPIYYRCGTFVSSKIGERKVREMWKEKDGVFYKCGFKHKFFASLSQSQSFKMKNIHLNQIYKNFEFEGKILNLAVTENFYFEVDEVKIREYKIENLLYEK